MFLYFLMIGIKASFPLLHNWLVGHIHKADKAYVPHLRTAPIVLAP